MKRWIACALVLALCLGGGALAERLAYADQGGVRVFEEETGFGLMDSDGNVLLPAEYNYIYPFEGDFAVIGNEHGTGVARRDGSVAFQYPGGIIARLYPDERVAVVDNDILYDLDTGALLARSENGYVSAHGDLLFVPNWSEEAGDYHTQALDKDGQVRFETDGQFVAEGLQPAAGLVFRDWAMEGWYSLIDARGRRMMEPFGEYSVGDDGSLYYARTVRVPLCTLLLRAGYDRERVRRGLEYYLGVSMALSGTLTDFMQWQEPRCGVVRPDGSRMEVRGLSMESRDGAGLYRVFEQDDTGIYSIWQYGPSVRVGYVDDSGAFVIEPRYDRAWPFVDGTAVVESFGACFLIDTSGNHVGSLAWTADDAGINGALNYPLIPVYTGVGLQIADRRGQLVSDDLFRPAWPWMNQSDRFLVLRDTQDRICAIDTSSGEIQRFEADICTLVTSDHRMRLEKDACEGMVCLTGERAGEWIIPPIFPIRTIRGSRNWIGYDDFENPFGGGFGDRCHFDADGRLVSVSCMDLEAHRELMKALGQYDDGRSLP